MIKISIIIPVYNAERFLEESLKSILNQTLSEIEIICVDDGSKDHSAEIIKKFQLMDDRVKLLTQENKGGGAARNRGMREAIGEYLLFLDADDFFESDMCFQSYHKALEKNADIVIFKANQYDTKQKMYFPLECACRSQYFEKDVFCYKDNPDRIFNSFHNYTWNKLFSHEFINKHNLKFQELHRTNDLLFTCSALVFAERITVLDSVLVHYRVGYNGNCQTTNYQYPLDFYYAFKALKDLLLEQDIYMDVRKSFINWAMEGCIYNLQSMKDFEASKKSFYFLKEEGFNNLDIKQRDKDFYYYPERFDDFLKINIMDYDEYLYNYFKQRILKKDQEIYELRQQQEKMQEGYQRSISFKIGRFITAVPRWCKFFLGEAIWKQKKE